MRRTSVMRLASALVLSLHATGCVNLAAVRGFAVASRDAAARIPAIAADLRGSCVRRAGLAPNPDNARNACDRFRKLEAGLARIGEVVESYLGALAALAGDEAVSFGATAKGLGETLSAAGLSEDHVAAARGLTSFLFEALSSRFRARSVREAIAACNGPLQMLVRTTREVVLRDYANLLGLERQTARSYYLGALKRHEEREPLAALLVRRAWREAEGDLDRRAEAQGAFDRALEKVGEGHQRLYDGREDLASRQILEAIVERGNAVLSLVRIVKKALERGGS
jgi:hypothetical protein